MSLIGLLVMVSGVFLIALASIPSVTRRYREMNMSSGDESSKYRLRWWTLAVLSISLLIIVVNTIMVNVAVPPIQLELNASASAVQWILSAYVLVFAGLLLMMGSLVDRFGRKRGLNLGLLVFGVSSVFAAYAQTSEQLIAARVLMGVGAAAIMPPTLSIIVDVFPRDERAKAIGIWTGFAALGAPLGLVVGGALLDSFWWGSIFLFNVPFVLAALGSALFLVPESRHPNPSRTDYFGSLLSIAILFLLIYAVIDGPTRGWLDPLVIGGFASALYLSAIFVAYELSASNPMIDLRLFSNPRFSSGAVATALSSLALLGFLFTMAQYFQFVRGYSALETGLGIAPVALGVLVGAPNAHRLIAGLGTKLVAAAGLMILASALVALSFLGTETGYLWIAVEITLLGFGFSIANVSATVAIMGAIPEQNAGLGSAVSNVMRQAGGALGIAIIGSVIASVYSSQVGVSIGEAQGGALLAAASAAFVDASRAGLLTAAGLAFAGSLLMLLFMPSQEKLPSPAKILELESA